MKLNGSGYMAHFAGFILIGIFKISFARKSKCGGPEEEIEGVHGRRKRKKLISGTEGEIVVAHGRFSYKRFPISQFYWFPLSCLTPVLAFRTLDLSLSGLYVRLSAFCINTIS